MVLGSILIGYLMPVRIWYCCLSGPISHYRDLKSLLSENNGIYYKWVFPANFNQVDLSAGISTFSCLAEVTDSLMDLTRELGIIWKQSHYVCQANYSSLKPSKFQ